jgi:hypothetical protein
VSGYTPPTTPGGYKPRYQVGDLVRGGFGQTMEIKEIHRASLGDGISSVQAINAGFTTYRMRPPGEDHRHKRFKKAILSTAFMHHMIDTGHGSWAYLGPSTETVDAPPQALRGVGT